MTPYVQALLVIYDYLGSGRFHGNPLPLMRALRPTICAEMEAKR